MLSILRQLPPWFGLLIVVLCYQQLVFSDEAKFTVIDNLEVRHLYQESTTSGFSLKLSGIPH